MFLSKRSNRIYYLWYRDGFGKKRKVSTRARRKTDALKFLQSFRESERRRTIRLNHTLLSDFTKEFLAYSKDVHRPKTQEMFRTALRALLDSAGDVPIQRLGIRDIEQFVAEKAKNRSERTVRAYFVTLASAFETAKRWNLTAENPFRQVEKPRLRELQPAYLKKADFHKLLEVVDDPDLRDLYICAVSTGLRLGELSALQWTDMDAEMGIINVRNSERFTTKSKRNRTVPMNNQVLSIMREKQSRAASELVFHRDGRRLTKEYVSKGFRSYADRAGLDRNIHFHSLRHTFASWLVAEGVSLYEVQRLLGHSSISITQTYSHLQPEQLHRTVDRISVELN
jgi:integrase